MPGMRDGAGQPVTGAAGMMAGMLGVEDAVFSELRHIVMWCVLGVVVLLIALAYLFARNR